MVRPDFLAHATTALCEAAVGPNRFVHWATVR